MSARAQPAAASAGCQRQPDVPTGSTSEQTLESGGRTRTYLVHLPTGFQPSRPTPLVLAFHGRKGTGNDIEAFSGIDALNAIAVYPRGLPGPDGETAWQGAPENSGADDVQFVGALLDRLESTLCVDQSRIFATGKSEGGGFTALLACRLPRRIAAFATVSGAFYPGTDAGCAGSPPVPLVDFHGTGDHVISYDGGVSHGEHYPSMASWLRRWTSHDRCADPTTTTIGSDVTELNWQGCAAGSALVHYRIAGGGHTWPGALAKSGPGAVSNTISATAVMWTFFQAHPLAQA
jgi:polyhydroxybutyrate depolymerase